MTPKHWRGDGTVPALIYSHGSGGHAREPFSTSTALGQLMERVVRAGFPVLSCHFGGNQWGNATAASRVQAAVNWLNSNGAKVNAVGMFGYSMGHLNLINYARDNRSKVKFVISANGVCDLQFLHDNTHGSSVDAAYGGNYSDATYGASYNPAVNAAAKFAGLPWLGYAGTADTTCPVSQTVALRNGIGASAEFYTHSGAHSLSTIGNYNFDRILEFMIEKFAA